MKVTLLVNGRKMKFSKEELSTIVEKHFNTFEFKFEENVVKISEAPIEGKWFKVNPKAINQRLFWEKREDTVQEETRQLILEAFSKIDKEPERYAKSFETMIPPKTWEEKNVIEFKELAEKLGGHMADWVEQALEWAQRINNGETWEAVCNNPDTANWYRMIVWKNTCGRMVGGANQIAHNRIAASLVDHHDCYSFDKFINTVPLVARCN